MPRPEIVHAKLGSAIVDALTAQEGCFAALVEEVRRIVRHGDPESDRRLQKLARQEADLDRTCRRLARLTESAPDVEEVVNRLRYREEERRQVRVEIERLRHVYARSVPLPTAEDVDRLLNESKARLLGDFGPEVGPLLRRLTTTIEAYPYRVFDRAELVLKAHFRLNPLGLMPDTWPDLLADQVATDDVFRLGHPTMIPMVVDLFEVPGRIRYAKPVAELVADGVSIKEAGARLGIPAWIAEGAWHTSRRMAERGLDDASGL
jgi:hypothetical protein